MFRSCTLSFESLQGFQLRLPKTLLAVVGVVCALELAIRCVPEKYLVNHKDFVSYMEKEALPRSPNPKLVAMGSSRMRDALVPKQLDRQMGWPDGSTINLGMPASHIYQSLYIYQRNEARLKSAEWVIFNVDDWQLSTHSKSSNLVFETYAPFSERLKYPADRRASLLADGIFTMRLKTGMLLNNLFSKKPKRASLDENNQVPRYVAPAVPSLPAVTIDMHYNKYNVDDVLLGHLEQLANLVKANGGKFIIMQLPCRSSFMAELEREHGAEFRRQREALEKLAAKLNVPFFGYVKPEEMGFTDDVFEDYGHPTSAGAKQITRFIGELLKKLENTK